MLRRTYIPTAAAAAVGYAQKTPLGIGFLGASHSHAQNKLKVVRSSSEYRLVGIAENDSKLSDQFKREGIALLSREELLRHPDIQVIAVESAVRDHSRDGKAVIEAGKHLHLEKAPADRYQDFEQIEKLAAERNRLVQVGYMWRYHPGIGKALEAAREGWLGQVYLLKAVIGNQLPAKRRPEWGEFPGGVMFELGCHVIDPMVRLMGKPKKVTPILQTAAGSHDSFRDNTVATLEWDHVIGIVQATSVQHDSSRSRTFEIHGTNGSAIVNPIEPPKMTINLAKAAGPYKAGAQPIEMPAYERFVDDFAELAAAIRGEGKLRVTPREDLLVEDAVLRCSGMA
jgi:predicted dehydrogenase